jgi:putative FmdB family regulatory protein
MPGPSPFSASAVACAAGAFSLSACFEIPVMPIYEYVCAACGAEVEVMHKISEGPGKCPQCKKDKLSKQISAAGFRLGGGGWYETDFKSGSDKKRNLAGGADAGTSSSPSEPSSSSKTDA